MDMVVVQARDDRCTCGVEHQLTGLLGQLRGDLGDPLFESDVGRGPVE
jgi:hypothetical protein